MNLYDLSRSIIRIETLIKFCENKGGNYYLSHAKRFQRRLDRMNTSKDKLIKLEFLKDITL